MFLGEKMVEESIYQVCCWISNGVQCSINDKYRSTFRDLRYCFMEQHLQRKRLGKRF